MSDGRPAGNDADWRFFKFRVSRYDDNRSMGQEIHRETEQNQCKH